MARSVRPVLADILEAIEGVERATAGKSFAEFKSDWLLRHGVQRAIEIISEACRHLPDDLLDRRPEIPWRKIRATGNVLRHEYFRIADDVIWSVVTSELPALKTAILDLQDTVDGLPDEAGG